MIDKFKTGGTIVQNFQIWIYFYSATEVSTAPTKIQVSSPAINNYKDWLPDMQDEARRQFSLDDSIYFISVPYPKPTGLTEYKHHLSNAISSLQPFPDLSSLIFPPIILPTP